MGLKWRRRPVRDGKEYTLVEVEELGVVSAVYLGPRRWRLSWLKDQAIVRSCEGEKYELFDALVDWGFSGESAGEIVRELYGG